MNAGSQAMWNHPLEAGTEPGRNRSFGSPKTETETRPGQGGETKMPGAEAPGKCLDPLRSYLESRRLDVGRSFFASAQYASNCSAQILASSRTLSGRREARLWDSPRSVPRSYSSQAASVSKAFPDGHRRELRPVAPTSTCPCPSTSYHAQRERTSLTASCLTAPSHSPTVLW
jgi:hypothetical protein